MPHTTIASNGHHKICNHLSDKLLHEGNWLKLTLVKYLDPEGVERTWETISRQTRACGKDTDFVTTIAFYRRMLHYDVVVFVRQYRPSLNKYTIEFPQGLLEAGDTAEETAVKTLLSETGWHGEVSHIGSTLAADPGCSSVTLRFATVNINGDALENLNPKPHPNDGEFLELIMIPLSEVQERLEGLANRGDMIDSKVAVWSIGLQMGLKVAKDAEQDANAVIQASLPIDAGSVRSG